MAFDLFIVCGLVHPADNNDAVRDCSRALGHELLAGEAVLHTKRAGPDDLREVS
jgi:hypothetical protein